MDRCDSGSARGVSLGISRRQSVPVSHGSPVFAHGSPQPSAEDQPIPPANNRARDTDEVRRRRVARFG